MKDVTISMDHVIEMTHIDGLPIFIFTRFPMFLLSYFLFFYFFSFVISNQCGEIVRKAETRKFSSIREAFLFLSTFDLAFWHTRVAF